MRHVLAILLVLGAFWGARELVRYWERYRGDPAQDRSQTVPEQQPQSSADALPGLPSGLESSLETATRQGPASLKIWLRQYRAYVQDPRLADIELDYVVLLRDPQEARAAFAEVKRRTPTNSPVYPRIKQLERTYE